MEKRKFKRVRKKILVTINNKPGIIIDISKAGIKLSTSVVPKTRDVTISLQVDDNSFNLKGNIRWVNRKFPFQNLNEIGVMIEDAPDDYNALLDKLVEDEEREPS